MNLRAALTSSLAISALAFTAAPAHAQQVKEEDVDLTTEGEIGGEEVFEFKTAEEEEIEEFQAQIEQEFALFGELFSADPLTEEQEARLPLAAKMTDKVFPEGTFAVVTQETIQPMFATIMEMTLGDPRTELANLTGMSSDDLFEIEDDAAQAALELMDPQYSARGDRMMELLNEMMVKLLSAIEPTYREALSRAFAVRFETAEIEELLVFFETPVGGKFARESILVQYDPQIMGAMEAMGPAMGEILPGVMADFEAFEADFPKGRTYPELSSSERARLSELLGKPETELEALAPEPEVEPEEEVEEGVI